MGSILEVKNLTVGFPNQGELRQVLKGVSFSVEEGDIVGIVGESGSGKSMTALSVMNLLPETAIISSGEIYFEGKDLLKEKPDKIREIQGNDMSMIFQEPMTSLNPVMKIGAQVGERDRKSVV